VSRIIKILSLTNSIIIDADLVPERVFLFYFHVILRRSTRRERYESCPLSFPLAFTLLLFSLAILFRGYVLSFPFFHPAARAPRKYRHYSSIMLLFFYTARAIREAPRLASPVSLLYVRRWVYEFYYALKLLLCLWHVFFIDANLFHIIVRSRGNKASPPSLTSIVHHLF